MSERLPSQHESHQSNNHELRKHKEALRQSAEKQAEASRHEHAEHIGEIRSKIEATSKSRAEHGHDGQQHENIESRQQGLVSNELKDMAYRRTLKRAQNKLPAPVRAFSKIVHNPTVDAASEITGKTIARPSGVLAGGIFAFLGSSLFLYITKHYGYEYNYLLFALFFVGGFFAGLLLELGLRLSNRKR